MNQADQIEKAIAELFVREKAYEKAVDEQWQAEHAYKKKRAEVYLRADGTIADRNSQADLECDEEYKRKVKGDAILALTKVLLEDCRNVISARQSILSAQSKTSYAMDMHAMKQT